MQCFCCCFPSFHSFHSIYLFLFRCCVRMEYTQTIHVYYPMDTKSAYLKIMICHNGINFNTKSTIDGHFTHEITLLHHNFWMFFRWCCCCFFLQHWLSFQHLYYYLYECALYFNSIALEFALNGSKLRSYDNLTHSLIAKMRQESELKKRTLFKRC